MTNNYRIALRAIALFFIGFLATQVLVSGSQVDQVWGQSAPLHVPSYAETLTKGHDCDIPGQLPNAAIVSYTNSISAKYITAPKKVDEAFNHALATINMGGHLSPNIDTVHYLCID